MTDAGTTTDVSSTTDPGNPTPAAATRGIRILHNAGWTFIYLGVFTLGFVVHQLFITTWFAQQAQSELAIERVEQWEETEISEVVVLPNPDNPNEPLIVAAEDAPQQGDGGTGRPAVLKVESPPELGSAFALIRIPKIDRLQDGWNVVEGVRIADLRNGAGHMPDTPLPGQPGNAVISGHRTTYGMPFHEIDTLDPGDRIEVDTALGTHIYSVREIHIVKPTDVWVADAREGAWLTLTSCHPKFSARQRYIVVAELVFGPNHAAIEVLS